VIAVCAALLLYLGLAEGGPSTREAAFDNDARARRGLLPRKAAPPRSATRARRPLFAAPAPSFLADDPPPLAAEARGVTVDVSLVLRFAR
jgi:hypothetical protein